MKLTVKTAYIALVFSIIFEQIGTACLEASQGFTKITPTIVLILAYIVCYFLFSKALKLINLSISYATWTALGTVGAALIGFFAFQQVISVIGWIAIVIMGIGIFILNLYGTPKEEDEKANDGGTEK